MYLTSVRLELGWLKIELIEIVWWKDFLKVNLSTLVAA